MMTYEAVYIKGKLSYLLCEWMHTLLPANLGVVAAVIPSGIFPWQFLLELDVFLYIKKNGNLN